MAFNLVEVEEELDEAVVACVVADLGQRVGVHLVSLAEVHVDVAVKHAVAHVVDPALEVLGLLSNAKVFGEGRRGGVVDHVRDGHLG